VAIEQAMYFALGFLVAGLFMLMFLPAFWRRAMRLSMRRLQMLAPLTREEAIAERDLLRADFAVRERRIEQEMEAVRATKAKDLMELGQRAARIFDLDHKLQKSQANARELDRQLGETRQTLDERTDLLNSTEMALHEMTERAERAVGGLRVARIDYEELDREKARVQTHAESHEEKIGDLHQENTKLRRELSQLQDDFAKLQADAQRLGDVDAVVARLNPELEATKAAKLALEQAMEALRASVQENGARHADQVAHLENALRHARDEARDHADRLEIARADNAMLQGAVEALRKDHERIRNGDAASEGSIDAREFAALRQEILNLGSRVVEGAQLERAE
jgi:chromosome segregation ATPase